MKITQHILAMIALAAVFLLSTGCPSGSVEGVVVDARGETLHGVAVTIEGISAHGLTNSLGRYRLPCPAGPVTLSFAKTGYTSGRLELPGSHARSVQPPPVVLWPLPDAKGVHFFDHFRYARTASAEPQPYLSPVSGTVYGTPHWSDVVTTNPEPMLVAFKLPARNVHMARLELADVTPQNTSGKTAPIEVWTPAEDIPVSAKAISDPAQESALFQIELPGPLRAGTYAVHWGSLQGDATLEPRLFYFSVVDAGQAISTAPAAATSNEDSKNAGQDPQKRKR